MFGRQRRGRIKKSGLSRLQTKPKRYVFVTKRSKKKTIPTSAVFGEPIRGTRVESFDAGWLEKKKLTLTGFESLRDDRREVTLPTEPFNTSASGARFLTTTLASRMKQLSWLLRSKRFRSKYECNCGFCLQSRSETTRCPAIKGYYAKLTPPCVRSTKVDSMQLKVIPFSDLNIL